MSDPIEAIAADPSPDEAIVAAAEPEAPPAEPDIEAQADAAIENAVAIPTGEKLAPVGALIAMREKMKPLKEKAGRLDAVEAEAAQLRERLAALEPQAQAYEALRMAQQVQPQAAQPTGPTPEQTAELEEVARDFDFYKPDGTLDLDRATRHVARVRKEAQSIAQEQVAPLVQQSVQARVKENIARAKSTVHPEYGTLADPATIDALVARLASQPGGTEMLANPESMVFIWGMAHGIKSVPAQRRQAAPAADAPVPIERSGGAAPQQQPGLSASERRAAKELGISEADYLKSAAKMPW